MAVIFSLVLTGCGKNTEQQDIENLKRNNGFKDEKKVQVISTLRDVLLRLEMILDRK